jgi:sodium/hydrogen antiporter
MGVTQGLFEAYDLLLIAVGVALLVTTLGVSYLYRLNLSKSYVYLLVGLLAGPLVLGLAPENPLEAVPVLERVAEFAVILSLIVVGIRIGRPFTWSAWQSTMRLILIVMPVSIALVAVSGYWLIGLALGPAILLGAVLAPTDPILAGAIEEHSLDDESEDRFGISSESGLNDGFAFPFIYLGLSITAAPDLWQEWLPRWVLKDFLYGVALALPIGFILGRLTGMWYVERSRNRGVISKRSNFIPLAALLAIYGLVEAIGMYGFLASFAAGLGFRHALDTQRDALESFANFSDSVDDLAKAGTLIILGSMLRWGEFSAVGWELIVFALVLIFVIRPSVTLVATARSGFRWIHRIYWAWFGIRGVGSIYYVSYAIGLGVVADATARTLLTVTIGTVLASMLFHGLTVRPFIRRWEGEEPAEE